MWHGCVMGVVYDLVVQYGRLADSWLINRLLVRGSQKTGASPAYLALRGVPSDIVRRNCVVGGFGLILHFGLSEKPESVRFGGTLITYSGHVLRKAALAGIGISQAT